MSLVLYLTWDMWALIPISIIDAIPSPFDMDVALLVLNVLTLGST